MSSVVVLVRIKGELTSGDDVPQVEEELPRLLPFQNHILFGIHFRLESLNPARYRLDHVLRRIPLVDVNKGARARAKSRGWASVGGGRIKVVWRSTLGSGSVRHSLSSRTGEQSSRVRWTRARGEGDGLGVTFRCLWLDWLAGVPQNTA